MQITSVHDNIRKFLRLTPLMSNPQYAKRIRDELDLCEALEVVAMSFHDTKNMVGKKMYKGQPFDPIEDVKRATEEYFLSGRTPHDVALMRGRNLTMYHLVVVPVIEMFKDVKHEDILKHVDQTIDELKRVVNTMDVQSHYDDALVTLEQVRVMIKQREEARKIELAKRKRGGRKKKRKDPLIDWAVKVEDSPSF